MPYRDEREGPQAADGQQSARKTSGRVRQWSRCCLLVQFYPPLPAWPELDKNCTSPAAQLILGMRRRDGVPPQEAPSFASRGLIVALAVGHHRPRRFSKPQRDKAKSLAVPREWGEGARDLSVIPRRIWGQDEPLEMPECQSSPAQVPLPSRRARPCGNCCEELTLP